MHSWAIVEGEGDILVQMVLQMVLVGVVILAVAVIGLGILGAIFGFGASRLLGRFRRSRMGRAEENE